MQFFLAPVLVLVKLRDILKNSSPKPVIVAEDTFDPVPANPWAPPAGPKAATMDGS